MHGAFYTGLWTAGNVDAIFKERKEIGRKRKQENDFVLASKRQQLTTLSTADIELSKARLHMLFNDPRHPPPVVMNGGLIRAIPGEGPFEASTLVSLKSSPLMDPIYALLPSEVLQSLQSSSLESLDNAALAMSEGPENQKVREFATYALQARSRGSRSMTSYYLEKLSMI